MSVIKLWCYGFLSWLFGYLKKIDIRNARQEHSDVVKESRQDEKKVLDQPHITHGDNVDINSLEQRLRNGTF